METLWTPFFVYHIPPLAEAQPLHACHGANVGTPPIGFRLAIAKSAFAFYAEEGTSYIFWSPSEVGTIVSAAAWQIDAGTVVFSLTPLKHLHRRAELKIWAEVPVDAAPEQLAVEEN